MANAWNPLGWTLISAATVGGGVLAGYKIYRRCTRTKRAAKRIAKYSGSVNVEAAVRRLIGLCQQGAGVAPSIAKSVLEEFGVTTAELEKEVNTLNAIALIKGHLAV